jgi:N,N'-diacetylbacillosaminyl-diphospho-undecaprenol alpha-1,3-N-acetylgalactosaminyltransferase
MVQAVHSIHFPVSARSFVVPMVAYLNRKGLSTELWVENKLGHTSIIEQVDVPKRVVASDLRFRPASLAHALTELRRQLRMTRPKVLHAHQSRASLLPLLAAYLEKVPLRVYHNHGLPYLGYKGILRGLLRSLEVVNIRLATHVLLVSHSNLAAAVADGLLAPKKGKVLANGSAVGVEMNEFAPEYFQERSRRKARENFGLSSGAFVLAYVGRPVRRKGFHLLLNAWERTGLGRHGNWLLIAGCTAAECAAALGHAGKGIKGVGYLMDLRPLYAACDAVVLPSQHEGFGYSLLEGAAAAKPLIGSDIPGIRCAIRHNQTGLLVRVNDEFALAQGIQRLAANPGLRLEMGLNARARAEREFSRETVLESLLNFYRNELDFSSGMPIEEKK